MEVKKLTNLHYVSGGVGKHLMFTALFDALVEKENKKLAVISPWPELFHHDDRVSSSHSIEKYDFLDGESFFKNFKKIYDHEPYKSFFRKGDTHIIDAWSMMYDLKNISPFPNFKINKTKEKLIQKEILKLGKFILVQFKGGQGIQKSFHDPEFKNQGRNFFYGQELINLIKEALPELNIIVFEHANENEYFNITQSLFVDKLDFMILAKYCLSFISIDSALQHMCANKSFNKKGIVLWGSTNSKMFGYDKNINLLSESPFSVEIKPQTIMDSFLKLDLDE